ncbi:MAG: hypothetical protein A2W27_05900 [Deltaproteobacteria bacterium RBG_16_44_11]|nr:MAG: hypothetical protein A2W27_05900 [Deltaproteobacteria bacterium RBG_16_44_11]
MPVIQTECRNFLNGIIIFIITIVIGFCPNVYGLDQLTENVYSKNSQQGISYEYCYALKDGKIWIKPNESTTGIKGEWKVFDSTGAPYGKDVPSFKPDDRIVGFSTDGTMIVAVSNNGRFYFWQPTLQEKTTWDEEIGSPFSDSLYLPKNKLWSFSFSILRAPWKRLTPMHDIVTYWEDIDGNKTQFGLTATIYVVDPAGQKIYFTDTGLPATFNRAFTSPGRGTFIIENMSSAASTVFVINEAGKMYTRMIDAEIEGGGPALMFTYKRGKRTKADEIVPIMDAMRSLPLPDWREQEPIAEVRDDRIKQVVITKNITILQTGEGNAARELRVQGRSRAGKYGYYFKKIFDPSWNFKITNEYFNNKIIVKNYLKEARKGRKLDKAYTGNLEQIFAPSLKIELIDFYYFSSPATLRVHVKNKQFDMKFHTVDQWNMAAQEKGHPELVGNPAGEPKLLQGTLEIPEPVLNSPDPAIKETVDRYFKRFHLAAFAFQVIADDKKVFIQSKIIQRASLSYMDYEFRRRITMDLVNTDTNSIVIPDLAFTAMAKSSGLEVPKDWQSMTKKDIPEIEKLLKLNKNVLWEMRILNLEGKFEHIKIGLTALVGAGIYYAFDGIINLIGLPSYPPLTSDPYINEELSEFGGLSYTGGDPLLDNAWLNFMLAFKDPLDYKKAEEIIEQRITLLKSLYRRLSKKPNRVIPA